MMLATTKACISRGREWSVTCDSAAIIVNEAIITVMCSQWTQQSPRESQVIVSGMHICRRCDEATVAVEPKLSCDCAQGGKKSIDLRHVCGSMLYDFVLWEMAAPPSIVLLLISGFY